MNSQDTLKWNSPAEGARPICGTMQVLCEVKQKYDNSFYCKKGDTFYQILSFYKKGILPPAFYLYDLTIPETEIVRWAYLPEPTIKNGETDDPDLFLELNPQKRYRSRAREIKALGYRVIARKNPPGSELQFTRYWVSKENNVIGEVGDEMTETRILGEN